MGQRHRRWPSIYPYTATHNYCEIFIKKYYKYIQKLEHLTYSEFVITTSLYEPIKLIKLKFVFSHEFDYMPDGLALQLYNMFQWNVHGSRRVTRK